MTPHFSDDQHLELCTGMNCNAMKPRSEMYRVEGKRSWWCQRCFSKKFPKEFEKKFQNP